MKGIFVIDFINKFISENYKTGRLPAHATSSEMNGKKHLGYITYNMQVVLLLLQQEDRKPAITSF
jgi:hypothetical protein